MAKLISIEESNEVAGPNSGWNGSLIDVVLERDGQQLKGTGITYLEEESEDYLDEVFDEWLELAEQGEDGFTLL